MKRHAIVWNIDGLEKLKEPIGEHWRLELSLLVVNEDLGRLINIGDGVGCHGCVMSGRNARKLIDHNNSVGSHRCIDRNRRQFP